MRILCVNVNKLYKVITCYNLKYKKYWYILILQNFSNWPWQWLRQDVVEELEHRADELRFTDWAPQLGDDMRRRQDCALDCPGLPSLDCHCRTNICAMCQSQSKFGTSPGGCGSCRGPSLMLCCCSVVPGIMVTVYACCLDNKVENLSAGSLQTAHIAHPSRSISATLSRGHLWSWRLRQVWMDEWLVKTRPCNGSLRPEELDAGNKGEQRGTKLSKKHWIVWFEELQEIHASHESYAYWMHLHLNKFFYCTGRLGRSTSRCPWTSCWFSSHPCWSEPGCVWHFAAEDKEPLLDTIDFAGSENHQEFKSIL